METVQIYTQPPANFASKVSVASCYLEKDGKLLLLRRAPSSRYGGLWGVPAGKLEKGETPLQAAIRELKEETTIDAFPSSCVDLGALYIRKPDVDYTFHMFHVLFDRMPEVKLNSEHDAFHWTSAHEIESMPLIPGARSCYAKFCIHALPQVKKRMVASVSVYLILEKQKEILLGLRKNTGYYDGSWGLPAGHVEMGEPATLAMIREAKEELGIDLAPSQLKLVHILHRQSNRLNVDFFFSCFSWKGKLENKELDKCEALQFFPYHALPKNLMPYNAQVFNAISQNKIYSEFGWE